MYSFWILKPFLVNPKLPKQACYKHGTLGKAGERCVCGDPSCNGGRSLKTLLGLGRMWPQRTCLSCPPPCVGPNSRLDPLSREILNPLSGWQSALASTFKFVHWSASCFRIGCHIPWCYQRLVARLRIWQSAQDGRRVLTFRHQSAKMTQNEKEGLILSVLVIHLIR